MDERPTRQGPRLREVRPREDPLRTVQGREDRTEDHVRERTDQAPFRTLNFRVTSLPLSPFGLPHQPEGDFFFIERPFRYTWRNTKSDFAYFLLNKIHIQKTVY